MSQFGFWQQWGAQLDDTQFANAWAALGVVWVRGSGSPRDVLKHSFQVPPGYRVPWRFPRGGASAELIAGTAPLEWANAWSEVAGGHELRLAVSDAPQDEPVMPWLRLLCETNPATRAVDVDLPGWQDRNVVIASPLRLGYLPGNGAETAMRGAPIPGRPTPTLEVAVGPAIAGCDVLVFRGTPAELLANRTALAGRVKFVLLLGSDGPDLGAAHSQTEADLDELGAAGYAIARVWPSAAELGARLSRLVQLVAADKYFDEAVAESFGIHFAAGSSRLDLYAALTAELASQRLSQPVPPVPEQAAPPPPAAKSVPREAAPPSPPTRGGGLLSGMRRRGVSSPAPGGSSSSPRPAAPSEPAPATRSAGPMRGARVEPPRPRAVPAAAAPAAAELASSQPSVATRYLQQQSFAQHQGEMREADQGFIAGQPACIKVFIGFPRADWNSAPSAFPAHLLPQDEEQWELDIWLTEPEHLAEPLVRTVKLPREGDSNVVDFDFTPRGAAPSFEGRFTVVHRGRVIQTAVLRASVQPDAPVLQPGNRPRLEDFIPVRQSLGDLKNRMRFDLAFAVPLMRASEMRT